MVYGHIHFMAVIALRSVKDLLKGSLNKTSKAVQILTSYHVLLRCLVINETGCLSVSSMW